MTPETMAKWFIGLSCLIGEEDRDYRLPETDPIWWANYLWVARN